jgi:hypothetical protein
MFSFGYRENTSWCVRRVLGSVCRCGRRSHTWEMSSINSLGVTETWCGCQNRSFGLSLVSRGGPAAGSNAHTSPAGVGWSGQAWTVMPSRSPCKPKSFARGPGVLAWLKAMNRALCRQRTAACDGRRRLEHDLLLAKPSTAAAARHQTQLSGAVIPALRRLASRRSLVAHPWSLRWQRAAWNGKPVQKGRRCHLRCPNPALERSSTGASIPTIAHTCDRSGIPRRVGTVGQDTTTERSPPWPSRPGRTD